MVNEELTAEEWKRRWEKEREKVARLKGQLNRAEMELERWRQGDFLQQIPIFFQTHFHFFQVKLSLKTNKSICLKPMKPFPALNQ